MQFLGKEITFGPSDANSDLTLALLRFNQNINSVATNSTSWQNYHSFTWNLTPGWYRLGIALQFTANNGNRAPRHRILMDEDEIFLSSGIYTTGTNNPAWRYAVIYLHITEERDYTFGIQHCTVTGGSRATTVNTKRSLLEIWRVNAP